MYPLFSIQRFDQMKCSINISRLISRQCGKEKHTECPQCAESVCRDHFDAEKQICRICSEEIEFIDPMLEMSALLSFDIEELRIFDADKQFDVAPDYLDS